MQTYTKIASRTDIVSTHHDFEVCDRLKRKIGCRIHTAITEFAPQDEGKTYGWAYPAGKYFTLDTQSTRNGENYQASSPSQHFATEAERDAAKDKYLKGASKRALKREGK